MKPTRSRQATLVDLLDRVLDKGVVLDADVIIQVAGIPLLGVKLRAALAGMETMLRYGMWEDWDAAQRKAARGELAHAGGGAILPAVNLPAGHCEDSAGNAAIREETGVYDQS